MTYTDFIFISVVNVNGNSHEEITKNGQVSDEYRLKL